MAYRARRNRSLSKGDVVGLEGKFYACASFGWDSIDPPRITTVDLYGTTSLTETERTT